MTLEEQLKLKAKARLRLKQQGGGAPTAPTTFADRVDTARGAPQESPSLWARINKYIPEVPAPLQPYGDEPNFDPARIGSTKGFEPLLDLSKIAADSVTLGGLNAATDKIRGDDRASKATTEARERTGPLGLATDVGAGSFTPTGLPAKVISKAPAIARGASSGVQAVIDAYLHGERDIGDLAKSGVAATGLTTALTKIAEPFIKRRQRNKAIEGQKYKTEEDLTKARKEKYAEVDESDAVYRNEDLKKLQEQLEQIDLTEHYDAGAIALRKKLFNERLRTGSKLQGLTGFVPTPGKDVSPSELDDLRKYVREKSKKDPNSIATGEEMIRHIDEFSDKTPVYKPPVTGVGPYAPAPSVNKALTKGRDLYGREKRHQLVREAEEDAARMQRRGRMNPFTPSPESADVMKFSDIAKKVARGKIRSKFTSDEIKGVEGVEEGTKLRNLGGQAEKISFSGGWAPWWGSLAAIPMTGGASVPLQIGAEVLHRLGRKATGREIEDVKALIRDPEGKGLKLDPETTDKVKAKLAKILASTYRASQKDR